MRVRVAVLHRVKTPFEVQEVELLPPREGEVLVRVVAAGVCHSDYHMVTGHLPHPLPAVLGHEGAGVVEALGPGVTSVKPGDHVIPLFKAPCGHCFYCLRGRSALCDFSVKARSSGCLLDGTTRLRMDGQPLFHHAMVACFAEYLVAPEQALLRIRPDIPLDRAALVGCAVTTGVGAVLFAGKVVAGNSVLIVGAGGVGLSAVQGDRLAGADPIIVADVIPAKLEWARKFGATHTINARERDVVAATRELTAGRGADHAFEVIGDLQTAKQAYEATRKGGIFVLVGVLPAGSQLAFDSLQLIRDEKTIQPCTYGSVNFRKDMPMFLDLYMSGRLNLDDLITRRFRLDEINVAYEAMLRGDVARGVITFD